MWPAETSANIFCKLRGLGATLRQHYPVFLIIPLSALGYLYGGLIGFGLAALILPALAIAADRSNGAMYFTENRDGLTGLPTPCFVDDVTRRWPVQMRNTQKKTVCFVIQADRFADFLAQHGETAGFQVQRAMAARIEKVLRDEDLVTRIGEATFKAVLRPVRHLDLEISIQMANRIKSAIEAPITVDATQVRLSASVGFCVSGQLKDNAMSALEEGAAIALKSAQKANGAAIRAFSPALLQKHQNYKKFCDEARDAIANGEVVAWFQPQISTETGSVTGFEALARWRHPQRGIVPPGEFLDTMAENGQLEKLSELMLEHALKALIKWEEKGYRVPRVGINFSGDELHNPMLADRLRWELDRFETKPSQIAIEILESVIAGGPDGVVTRNVNALAEMGCHIDLDDFGTGHASISSIQRFSTSRLKIDRSFVTGVNDNTEQQKLIAAIITMAEQLGISTLAEGVETAGEHAMLAQLGCDHVQGYGIARPMPFEDTIPWMRQHLAKLPDPPKISGQTR